MMANFEASPGEFGETKPDAELIWDPILLQWIDPDLSPLTESQGGVSDKGAEFPPLFLDDPDAS